MGKKEAVRTVLADNLARLMQARNIKSEKELEKLSKVSQKSINNILNKRHDPYLSTIEKLSTALEVEPYELLCAVTDNNFLAVCLAWAQSDERGRGDLHAIAEAMLKRRDRGTAEKGDNLPLADRRRNEARS